MNPEVTPTNVTKVISIATAVYWVFAAVVLLSDLSSGEWLQKGGLWILLVLLTGFCGTGFWVVMAPTTIRAFQENRRPLTLKKLGKALWCASTIPLVLFCLCLVLLLVYYRVTEG